MIYHPDRAFTLLFTLFGAAIADSDDYIEDYYSGIDTTATDDNLKGQLQELIYPHTVYTYDDVWSAFSVVDENLPQYPCDANLSHIPDIYSTYCWSTEQGVSGGECGNYKKEGDCFNREHIWPKSWFGGTVTFQYHMLIICVQDLIMVQTPKLISSSCGRQMGM